MVSVRLLAAVGCVLTLAVTGCGQSSEARGRTYSLLQMNLCLSGLAGCYDAAVVDEATSRTRHTHPDAVTVNEACSGDVARIARDSGYHLRFSRVIYAGRPLPCIHPTGRGLFGDAVMTKAAIKASTQAEFKGQKGVERRRWICVTTRGGIEVCTAHLNTRDPVELSGNEAQCAELRALLARRARGRTVIFGGDLNRRQSCAPRALWIRTDRAARQKPGLQQVYGTAAFRAPSAEVLPATHTDHDFLLVHAEFAQRRG